MKSQRKEKIYNMLDEKKYMEIIDENDNVIKYEILLSFVIFDTGKHYVIYTDNTFNEKNELKVYASIYNPLDDTKLEKIETEQEWDIINKQINKLISKK